MRFSLILASTFNRTNIQTYTQHIDSQFPGRTSLSLSRFRCRFLSDHHSINLMHHRNLARNNSFLRGKIIQFSLVLVLKPIALLIYTHTHIWMVRWTYTKAHTHFLGVELKQPHTHTHRISESKSVCGCGWCQWGRFFSLINVFDWLDSPHIDCRILWFHYFETRYRIIWRSRNELSELFDAWDVRYVWVLPRQLCFVYLSTIWRIFSPIDVCVTGYKNIDNDEQKQSKWRENNAETMTI